MNTPTRGSGDIIVRDTRPMRTLNIVLASLSGLVVVSWTLRRPPIGIPLAVATIVLTVLLPRLPGNATVASPEGIAGLRVRVPRSHRTSWFHRYEVVHPVTPWEQIESVSVGASALSLTRVQIHLADGREADLSASAVSRRGLRKLARDLERLRPPPA